MVIIILFVVSCSFQTYLLGTVENVLCLLEYRYQNIPSQKELNETFTMQW